MCLFTAFIHTYIHIHIHTHTHAHLYIYIYIYIYHHEVALAYLSSLTFSCYPSLTSIIPCRFSLLHLMFAPRWCTSVFADWPTRTCLYAGVHYRISLESPNLLLWQCSDCLVRIPWKFCVIGVNAYVLDKDKILFFIYLWWR